MSARKIPVRLLALVLALSLGLAACGLREGDADRYAQAREEAYAEGYAAGREQGYRQGLAEAQAATVPQTPPETEPPEPPATEPPETEPPATAPYEAYGLVSVAEAVPEVILEIRYYSTYNFVGERIDGYEAPVALLTAEAAEALGRVSEDLMARGYRLKIYDAYRPQRAVSHFLAWAQAEGDDRMKAYFYPELDKSVLFDRGYIAARSGHSRGSTVDLTLFDMATGREVDMGGTFDYFGARSHPDYQGDLTEEQRENRRILREAMVAQGFRGISTEWWHFVLAEEPYPDTYFDFPITF